MNWIYKLQRKFRFGIDNLMLYITVAMLAVYLADNLLRVNVSGWLVFSRAHIFSGQIWRLLSFIFLPPNATPMFVLIALYFYYFLGNTLENAWGSSQFTLYYLFGVIGAIIAGLLTGTTDNYYINLSLVLAYAQLFPEQEFLLFFVIPVKAKYFAYVAWALYAIALIGCLLNLNFAGCAAIIMSLLNFFLFFGPDIKNRFDNWRKYGKRRREFKKQTRDNDFWR